MNQLESELQNSLNNLGRNEAVFARNRRKNTTLELENQRLREHIRELNQVADAPAESVKQELSKSRMNLEKDLRRRISCLL